MDQPSATTATSATWNYPFGRTITIHTELAPGQGFSRQKRIVGGVVVIPHPAPRDRTLYPFTVQDDELWRDYKENSFEGGHIIGLKLGGPDHPLNIAPMNKGANCGSGTWGVLEQKMKELIKANMGGAVNVDLTFLYNDSIDPRIPYRVQGTVGNTPVNAELRPPTDRTNIVGKEINRLFRDIEELAEDYNLHSTSNTPHAPLDIVDRNVLGAQALRNRIRQIPLLSEYPVGGVPRKSKPGKPMNVQRWLMMLYNRYRNGGLLMAEDPHNLGFLLNEWRVQADHIRPYSKSGNRYYRNLRLVHHRTNNKRGAGGVNSGGVQRRVRKPTLRYSPY